MHLWNDYEGKTIAEAYPLERLLRPEGRSAFFVTPDKTGAPHVIRLTESLNDEHEMLERWRQVSEVHQENLVAIKTYGQTTFDGVPLAYALMEPTDGSLAEILAERPLTAAETQEVAGSLVAAVSALHEMNLIHEHIEAANVLASGDVIKLRSDCVRECIEDGEFNTPAMCAEFKQKDVHDLAGLLLRCLTLEKTLTALTRLPAPFDRIIPNGLDGCWSLKQIAETLRPAVAQGIVPDVLQVRQTVPVASGVQPRFSPGGNARTTGLPQVSLPRTPVQTALPFDAAADGPTLQVRRVHDEVMEGRRPFSRNWIIGGAATILLVLVAWFLVPSKKPGVNQPALGVESRVPTIDDAPDPGGTVSAPANLGRIAPAANGKSRKTAVEADTSKGTPKGKEGWRVVCYTFSHEDQAWERAGAIHKAHPGLNAQVFAVSARGPYLITLGGFMDKAGAETVLRRARRDGLPRDTFTRFYPTR